MLSSAGSAIACSYPVPPTFEDVAPTAEHVVQLEYRQSRDGGMISTWIEGRVRVVETFRGDPKFTVIRFDNGWCGGIRLDVGHSYLVVTNETDGQWQFAPGDKTVIDISLEYNPSRPDAVETSRVLQRLLRALEGRGSFRDIPRTDYYLLTSPLPILPP